MTLTKEIKIGWKALKTILENLRKAINHNQPLRGDGIKIDETEAGCIISLDKPGDNDSQSDGTMPPMTSGQWTPVTVVDPATCAQSTLYVWALPPGTTI